MNGEHVSAVVLGGGEVGTRKTIALVEAGVSVRVIAPRVSSTLSAMAATDARITVIEREYEGVRDLSDADIVFAATDSPELNSRIARDARAIHRLVNVVSDGSAGTFTSMALHRAGQLTIGVSTGGVPAEAARVRDELSRSYDAEYAAGLDKLALLRQRAKEAVS